MKYLFIDGWCDYSIITDSNRQNQVNLLFLSYATIIHNSNMSVSFLDAKDDDFTKEKMFSIIEKENIKKVIFYVNIDNIHSLLRLQKELENINVYFLSINEDLSSLFLKKKHITYMNHDENHSYNYNISNFLKINNIRVDENLDYSKIPTDYSFCKNLNKKTVLVSIGSGCPGECSFCNISNSKFYDKNIDVIICEIKLLLKQGVKYFHIVNHSFSCDRMIIELFCKKIKKLTQSYNFFWSCYILPSYFKNHLDLFPLMVEAKLGKIEIGCESGSEDILKQFNLRHSNSDIEKIINEAICANVPSIGCHFIIGSDKETNTSLEETKEFIMKILDLSYSLCDIYIHGYFPEKSSNSDINYEIIKKRHGFVRDINGLSIWDLNNYKKLIFQLINLKRKELVGKAPLRVLYKQYEISKYKIRTQVFKNQISKSLLATFFTRKDSTGNGIFFSWEITDSIENYTPIYYDPTYILLEELKEDYSNLNRIILYYLKKHLTVGELTNVICNITNNAIDKNYIIAFLKELENNKRLFYSKYLH